MNDLNDLNDFESSLNDLLEESFENEEGDLELDDLESLLEESLEVAENRRKVEEAKKAARRKDISPEELEANRKLIRSWEDQQIWRTVAFVALLERKTCECCGSLNESFVQYLGRQEHRKELGTIRYAVPSELSETEKFRLPTLPKQILYRDTKVPFCPLCMAENGWGEPLNVERW